MTAATEVKGRPILFSGPMVRAILDGRKTQTRRIVKELAVATGVQDVYHRPDGLFIGTHLPVGQGVGITEPFTCPYGEKGERLIVRETWRTAKSLDDFAPREIAAKCAEANYTKPWAPVEYVADGARDNWDVSVWGEVGKTRVSIHMPHWLSRITLEIESVKVERLNAISETDAMAEGVEPLFSHDDIHNKPHYRHELNLNPMPYKNYLWHGTPGLTRAQHESWEHQFSSYDTACNSFSSLWESINGPGSWQASPFVWVITFRKL